MRRARRDEGGFTLLELMVVVLIIAILLAIGVPSLLGAREAASDRTLQTNLRTAFSALRVFYNADNEYPPEDELPTLMSEVEPGINWRTGALGPEVSRKSISVHVFDRDGIPNQIVVLAGRTKTGKCFYLKDVMGGGADEAQGTHYASNADDDGPGCTPPDLADEGWSDKWER